MILNSVENSYSRETVRRGQYKTAINQLISGGAFGRIEKPCEALPLPLGLAWKKSHEHRVGHLRTAKAGGSHSVDRWAISDLSIVFDSQ